MRFCTECGAAIEPGADFCYACGATFRSAVTSGAGQGAADQPEPVQYDPAAVRTAVANSMKVVAYSVSRLIMVWVVLAIVMGAVSIIVSPYMKEFLEEAYGTTITDGQILFEGGCLFASGFLALTASMLLRRLRLFWVCLISCIAAALVSYPGMGGITGVITAAIGLYMSMAIFRCRPVFDVRES